MMARRMMRKHHVRCRAGEKVEITSKPYLSLCTLCARQPKTNNTFLNGSAPGKHPRDDVPYG